MSPAWDMASPPVSGTCARCGRWTDAGVRHWIPRMTGADIEVILCADMDSCTPPPKSTRPRRYPT